MTTTDELGRRVAVLINLHQRGTDLGPTVDTIIRLVVDACAREAEEYAKRWENSTLYPDSAIRGAAARIRRLANADE